MNLGLLDQSLCFGTLVFLLVQGSWLTSFKVVPQNQLVAKNPVETEFQRLQESGFEKIWELQHYHPKACQPVSKVNEKLQKMFLGVSQIQVERKKNKRINIEAEFNRLVSSKLGAGWELQHSYRQSPVAPVQMMEFVERQIAKRPDWPKTDATTDEAKKAQSEQFFSDLWRWEMLVKRSFDHLRLNPSRSYTAKLKQLIEAKNPPWETGEGGGFIRQEAVFTLGVIGGEEAYVYRLVNSDNTYVYAGAIQAIAYRLSFEPGYQSLEEWAEKKLDSERHRYQYHVLDAIRDLCAVAVIKKSLVKTASSKEKIQIVMDEMYLDGGYNGGLPYISTRSLGGPIAVREFYRIYAQNRPQTIQILREMLADMKDPVKWNVFLFKMYVLGVPITQQERQELERSYGNLGEWKPLTILGVPIYNPADYKRK